jgi:hypothetical protein
MRRNTVIGLTAVLAVGLALGGCTQDGVTGPSGSPTPTSVGAGPTTPATAGAETTPGPTPRPTSTIASVPGVDHDGGTIPSSCTDLITAGRWDDVFASAPLNDPSVVGDPVVVPKNAFTPVLQPDGKRLYCVWKDPRADVSYLSIAVDVVDSTRAFAELQQLTGFDCDREAEGYRCQKTSQNPQYPVTDGDTYFTRGDVGIEIRQSNTPTDGLLEDVEAHVF